MNPVIKSRLSGRVPLMRSRSGSGVSERNRSRKTTIDSMLLTLLASLCVQSGLADRSAVQHVGRLTGLRGGATELKTDEQRWLYAMGCNVGRQVGDLDCLSADEIDFVLMGVKDTLTKTPAKVDLVEVMPKAASFFKERHLSHLSKIEAASQEAVEKASAEEGATTTASGLVIKHLVEGEGEPPGETDTVKVHYVGTLAADGSTFDSSLARGEPVEFPLNAVVKGWTEGLQLMRPGGKAKLTVPAHLGYGDMGKAIIPPKAALVFEITLLEVVSKGEATSSSSGGEGSADEEELVV